MNEISYMGNLNLIDLVFERVSNFIEICTYGRLKIDQAFSGKISFRIFNKDGTCWYSLRWKNKEEFLVDSQFDRSLFTFSIHEYENSDHSYLRHERYVRFVNMCKTLKGCESIEELALKMDLMGI